MDSPCTSSETDWLSVELQYREDAQAVVAALRDVQVIVNLEVLSACHEFLEMLHRDGEEPGGDSFSPDTSEPYPF